MDAAGPPPVVFNLGPRSPEQRRTLRLAVEFSIVARMSSAFTAEEPGTNCGAQSAWKRRTRMVPVPVIQRADRESSSR